VSDQAKISRRGFLGISIFAIGGIIGLGYLLPTIFYIIAPALQRKEEQEWLRLGSTAKVEIGTPTLYKVKIQRKTGWIVNEEEISVYVSTEDGRNYIALSNICTHLGCRVRWISEQELFFCPCHNAIFNENGQVVEGPPPKALDQYETKVEDDQIYILLGG